MTTEQEGEALRAHMDAEAARLAYIGNGLAVFVLLGELFAALPNAKERLQRASARILQELGEDENAADVLAPALASIAQVAELARQ